VGESAEVPEWWWLAYDVATRRPWESASAGRRNLMQSIYDYMAVYDSTQDSALNGI
jgi:hypothetical protein